MSGDELRELRLKYGLSQKELAFLMHFKTKGQISKMESGSVNISHPQAYLLRAIFDHLKRGLPPPEPTA